MLTTELYNGQGLGNQIWCYIVTRIIALDKGYDFGIMHPEKFKGAGFLSLDFGMPVTGGSGPEGGPPTTLPDGIRHYYKEAQSFHPRTGADITPHDATLVAVKDNTKIDGNMQDEQYIAHRRDDIRAWLTVRTEDDCFDYASDDICVLNFRGGEYVGIPDVFLPEKYWHDAMRHMRETNPNFRFVVVTDDVQTAKKFFPSLEVVHFSIGKDYAIVKNAHYLILSNSSFGWFPAWTNTSLKRCIAPKYWAQYNTSDGYWGCDYNITSGWEYLDRTGKLSSYEESLAEKQAYSRDPQKGMFTAVPVRYENPAWLFQKNLIRKIKKAPKVIPQRLRAFTNRRLSVLKRKARKYLPVKTTPLAEIAEYRKNIKLYDVFTFFNELELLEMRLNILDPYVDFFVIVEATETFSGKPKPLHFADNKHLFKKWEHKIIHHVVTDTPVDFVDARLRLVKATPGSFEHAVLTLALTSDNVPAGQVHWLKEFYQKESLKKPLIGASGDDFVYISDVDEIWNPEAVVDYRKNSIFKLEQLVYTYYLNNRSSEPWAGTLGTQYKNIQNSCLNHLRTFGKTSYAYIPNGGWHFTNMGGADRIRTKLESYGHQEFNNETIKDSLENKIEANADFVGRKFKFWIDDSNLPKYLTENVEKFRGMFK